MTDLVERSGPGIGGRLGRAALRVLLVLILASPILVGFLLAPKADDMPPPPELAAPPSVTSLPEAVRRILPASVLDQTQTKDRTQTLSGG
jgi:hypothetical protein